MKEIYKRINKWSFWVCLISSIVLFAVSFVIPPYGAIDPSVLRAACILLGFLVLDTVRDAIMKGADITVQHGDTTVKVDNPDE